MCSKNRKDVEEINPEYIKDLKFDYIERAEEVLELALTKNKVKKPINFVLPELNQEKKD
jgi:ATP-dependent Lon protease